MKIPFTIKIENRLSFRNSFYPLSNNLTYSLPVFENLKIKNILNSYVLHDMNLKLVISKRTVIEVV
jgi:hypothetical protein